MEWLSENLELITTCGSLIVAAIGWYLKNRATLWNNAKLAVTEAIEKAELLIGAKGDQKKEYALALLTYYVKKYGIKKISDEIEKQIQLTKNVNVKKTNSDKEIY